MSDQFVQAAAEASGVTAAIASITVVNAGATLVAFMFDGSVSSTPAVNTVVSSVNGAFSPGATDVDGTNFVWGRVYTLANVSAGAHTVTGTLTTGGACDLFVVEVNGTPTSPVSDTKAQFQNAPGTANDAISSLSLTIPSAVTIIAFSTDSASASGANSPTVGTGFTTRGNGANSTIGAWRLESITASSNAAGTFKAVAGGDNYVTLAAAILNAAGASTPTYGFSKRFGPGSSPDKLKQFRAAPRSNFLSPNLSVALTGVSSTSSSGSVGVAISIALTGQSSTSSAGSVGPTLSLGLSGQGGTSGQGNVGASQSALTIGQIIQGGPVRGPFNNLQFLQAPRGIHTGDVFVAISGVQSISSLGTLGVSLSFPLTGAQATGSLGSVAPSLILGLSGSQGTGSLGSVSAGSDVTLALTGTQSTSAIGDISHLLSVGLTGAQGTSAIGNLGTPTIQIPLVGIRVNTSTGTIVSSGGVLQGLTDNGTFVKRPIFLVSPSGKVKWVDYIPIKEILVSSIQADRFDDVGALSVKELGSVTGLVAWVDYIPCALVSDPNTWRTDDIGYIPVVKIV